MQQQQQSNDAAGGYWLDPNNPDFDQIQYYLKTCLQDNGECENLEVWKIENLENSYRYERKTSNMLKVACWMNTDGMDGGYSLEEICTRGLKFDRTERGGMEFKTGIIDFDSKLALYTSYCFIYFEVAVGKSYVYDGDLLTQKLPNGYDSFYLPSSPLDRNQDGEFDISEYQAAAQFDNRSPNEYQHSYFVKDASQVCAKYVVRFDLTKSKSKKNEYKRPSEDDMDGSNTEIYTHYDPITLAAVSMPAGGTAVVGGISSPGNGGMSANSSNLIPISQAYPQAVEAFLDKHQDPVAQSKHAWTARQLALLEEKVREVNLNYAEVHEAIEEAAAAAVSRLQSVTRTKLETLLSLEIELRRGSEQMGWLDAHIDEQFKSVQSALANSSRDEQLQQQSRLQLDFLRSWKYYTVFRNSVSRAKPAELQTLATVHGDTKVRPDIQIFSDPFYANSSATSSTGFGNLLLQSTAAANNNNNNNNNNNINDSNYNAGSTAGSSGGGGGSGSSYLLRQPQPTAYAAPLQPTELLVSAALQQMADGAMVAVQEHIQAAMAPQQQGEDSAVSSSAIPLPRSVQRPMLGGSGTGGMNSGADNIPLHELLDGLQIDAPAAPLYPPPPGSAAAAEYKMMDDGGGEFELGGGIDVAAGMNAIGADSGGFGVMDARAIFSSAMVAASGDTPLTSAPHYQQQQHQELIHSYHDDEVFQGEEGNEDEEEEEEDLQSEHKVPSLQQQPKSETAGRRTSSSGAVVSSRGMRASVVVANSTMRNNNNYDNNLNNNNDRSITSNTVDSSSRDRKRPSSSAAAAVFSSSASAAGSGSHAVVDDGPSNSNLSSNNYNAEPLPPRAPFQANNSRRSLLEMRKSILGGYGGGGVAVAAAAAAAAAGASAHSASPTVSSSNPHNTTNTNRMNNSSAAATYVVPATSAPVGEERWNANASISMDALQLAPYVEERAQFSLREIGSRKRKQFHTRLQLQQQQEKAANSRNKGGRSGAKGGVNKAHQALSGDQDRESAQAMQQGLQALSLGSCVIQGGMDDAEDLFFCLPFFANPPQCRLVYSTGRDHRSLEELFTKTARHRGPSLLLIRSGEFVFGAFLTHTITPTRMWSGSPSCFLFSVTLGIKLPYHGRTAGDLQRELIAQQPSAAAGLVGAATTATTTAAGGMPTAPPPLAFYAQPDALFIGNGDLSIDGELRGGSSEVENCYGCGLNPRGPEALCLLAGRPLFDIDALELWAVMN